MFFADPSGADAIWSPNKTSQNNHKPNEHPNRRENYGASSFGIKKQNPFMMGGGFTMTIKEITELDVVDGLYANHPTGQDAYVEDIANAILAGEYYNDGNNSIPSGQRTAGEAIAIAIALSSTLPNSRWSIHDGYTLVASEQIHSNGPDELVTFETSLIKILIQTEKVEVQKKYDFDLGINTTATANALMGGGIYTGLLERAAKSNSKAVYKYGSKTVSAATLTARNSSRMTKIASRASLGGKIIGGAGILLSTYQYANNEISGTEALVDSVMGVVGLLPGWGTGISVLYFGGKALYEYYSGETLFEKPKKN